MTDILLAVAATQSELAARRRRTWPSMRRGDRGRGAVRLLLLVMALVPLAFQRAEPFLASPPANEVPMLTLPAVVTHDATP